MQYFILGVSLRRTTLLFMLCTLGFMSTLGFFATSTNIEGFVHTFSISKKDAEAYGFFYPMTFCFNVSDVGTITYCRNRDGIWFKLPRKSPEDFFNGVEVIRFEGDVVYVSVAFNGSQFLQIFFTSNLGYPLHSNYIGIAKYYDNRRCAVITTYDDFATLTENWKRLVGLHRKYGVWCSIGIETMYLNETTSPILQNEIDKGYVDVCSHSVSHVYPYEKVYSWDYEEGGKGIVITRLMNYTSQIINSKKAIINNLTLPFGQFVYAWIEPFGITCDEYQQICGENGYLVSRSIGLNDALFQQIVPFNENFHLFEIMPDLEIFNDSNATYLNSMFDKNYENNDVYLICAHPNSFNQTVWQKLEIHLAYIGSRENVWYPSTGTFYLYQYAKLIIFHT